MAFLQDIEKFYESLQIPTISDEFPAWILEHRVTVLFVLLISLLLALLFCNHFWSHQKSISTAGWTSPIGYPNAQDIQVALAEAFRFAKTAYIEHHLKVFKDYIISCKLDKNSIEPSTGMSFLLCACVSGNLALVEFLLERDADVTYSTPDGDSAIYLACYGYMNSIKKDFSLISRLIELGCDVNSQNKAGYTALHAAASSGDHSLVKFLLSKGGDPLMKTAQGISPLDCAFNSDHHRAAALLVEKMNSMLNTPIAYPQASGFHRLERHRSDSAIKYRCGTGGYRTPPAASLGFLTPGRVHLTDSNFQKRRVEFQC